MVKAADCIQKITKGSELSEAEVLEMIAEFDDFKMAKIGSKSLSPIELSETTKAFLSKKAKSSSQEKVAFLYTKLAEAKLSKQVDFTSADSAFTTFDDAERVVRERIETNKSEALMSFRNALKEDDLSDVWEKKGTLNHVQVNRYMSQMTTTDTKAIPTLKDIPTEFHNEFKIAQKMHKHLADDRAIMKGLGVDIDYLENRSLRSTHNAIKLDDPTVRANALERAITDWDWDKVSTRDYDTKEAFIEDWLDRVELGVESGEPIKQRRIHFKDPDKWLAWQEDFGAGPLDQAFEAEILINARKIAMIEELGHTPEATWKKFTEDTARQTKKLHKEKSRGKDIISNGENYYNAISGKLNDPRNFLLAQVGNAIRQYEAAAHLGGLVITQAADPLMAGLRKVHLLQSKSVAESAGAVADEISNYWKGLFEVFPDTEARAIFKSQMDVFETLYADMASASRFSADSTRIDLKGRPQHGVYSALNVIEDSTNSIMKFNFGQQMTNKALAVNYPGIAREWGELSGKAFADLSDGYKSQLRQVGLEKHWDFVRTKVKEIQGSDGVRKYINPADFDNISDADVLKINPKATSAAAKRIIRKEVKSQVRAAFAVESKFRTLMPDDTTDIRTAFKAGKGTRGGELIDTVFQFKSFPIGAWKKVIGPALKSSRVGVASWTPFALGTGMMITWIHDLASGKSPRPFWVTDGDEAGTVFKNYIALMGRTAGYPFLDNLVPKMFSGEFQATDILEVAGPAVGDLGKGLANFAGIGKAAVKGDGGEVASRVVKAATSLPVAAAVFGGTVYGRFTQNLFMDTVHEVLDPGSMAKKERYARKQGSQYSSHYQLLAESLGID